MTRQHQKDAERHALDRLLSVLVLSPTSIVPGEAPDFVVLVHGAPVGVEITLYQSGDVASAGISRRQVESEWEALQREAIAFRESQADLANINVGLMFESVVPPRREHRAFISEIAAFISLNMTDLGLEDSEFWPGQFSSPLMAKYLRTLIVRTDRFATWYSNITAGWVARPDAALARIVIQKSSRTYRSAEHLWLVIETTPRISETCLPLGGGADLQAVPELATVLRDSPFERGFLFTSSGILQWTHADGWVELAPAHVDEAPSLDELKGVLRDPEWLADPHGKADRVAREVLQELQSKGQS